MNISMPKSERNARWRVLVACLVCQMGLGLGAYIFAVFLKPIVVDLDWSRTSFSISTLPLLLAMSLASPLVGALTDRLGARPVFSIAITLVAVALALFSVMQSLWQFYAIGLLLGIGATGLGDIPAGAVVSRWFRRQRGFALGLVYIGSNIGGAIVPIVATAVSELSSWRVALRVLSVGGWLLVFPFAFWGVRGGAPADAAGESAETLETGELDGMTLADAMRTPSFWLLCWVLFSFYFYYIGVNNHLVAFLSDSGFTDAQAGRRFGAAVAVGILGKIGVGLFADRIRKRAAIVTNFAVMTLGSVALLFVGDAPRLLPVFLLVHGFTVAAENVVVPLMVGECFGVQHLARIYGAIMLMLLPAGVAGPVFAGYVFDTLGSYWPAFATFAATNVIGVAALFGLRPLAANRALAARRASAG